MFISISAVPINPVRLLLWVLGSQGNVIFEIQFGLRVTLARLEFDHEVVLYREYGIGGEVLVVRGEDLGCHGFVAWCSDLERNISAPAS